MKRKVGFYINTFLNAIIEGVVHILCAQQMKKKIHHSESRGEGVGRGVGEILVKTSRGRIVGGEGRIDAAGWFHTGDLGRWVPSAPDSHSSSSSGGSGGGGGGGGGGGSGGGGARQLLEVVDRRGFVVKLANGEFLSPSKAEAVFEARAFFSRK